MGSIVPIMCLIIVANVGDLCINASIVETNNHVPRETCYEIFYACV